MNFVDFIEKYYPPSQQPEIIYFLNQFSLYTGIESSLNDFYQAAETGNKNDIILQLVLTIREFAITICMPLNLTETSEQKVQTDQKIKDLTANFIRETYQLSGLKGLDYIDFFLKTARRTCIRHSLNFTLFENISNQRNSVRFMDEQEAGRQENKAPVSGPVRLNWSGEKQLDLFVEELTKLFKGIKCKKKVYLLFENTNSEFKIELPSKHLLPFLNLFYELHDSRIIHVIGNRGLFVYLHQHLQAPSNDRYPKREFRKIRYEALRDEKKMKDIFKMIHPLLYKFSSKKDRTIAGR